MIIINDKKTLGSKGFASSVFDNIKVVLDKLLDKEQIQEIANEVEFFGELDLSVLDSKVFNTIFKTVQSLKNLDKRWQGVLLDAMQADPRYAA